VNPPGTGLFFVGRLFITVSISSLVIDLYPLGPVLVGHIHLKMYLHLLDFPVD
jgi:hypothetical protein